ncbi:restriction endonuclease [Ruminococcus sp. Marseille-P6503]|uniref:restriction endonuclease n=1 Tax=Ruminococcus sp. Marseille-P6503 TaxID=2364796 RepID=UPI000F541C80|nr:restriction endonuclease [Ruminococcus sp. Marseille-P6503]
MDKESNNCVTLVKKIIWYIIKTIFILFASFVLIGIIFISLPEFWYLYIIGLIIILFIRLTKRKSIYTIRLYTIEQLDLMGGHQFEYACADILRENGFKKVKVTKGSGDFGVDIIAEKDDCRYAIQCKRYSSNLGNKPIQEVVAGLAYYDCSKGAVMTNQYFTEHAKVLAKVNGVQLWDRKVLQGWLRKCNKNSEKENLKDDILLKIECDKTVNNDCSDKLSDNLVWKAIVEIANSQNASTVFIQRKLMLGHLKADKILNSIEELGLIGSKTEQCTRKVNIRKEDLPYIKTKFSENIITLNKRINDLTEDKAEQAVSGTPQSESNEIESTLIGNLEDN